MWPESGDTQGALQMGIWCSTGFQSFHDACLDLLHLWVRFWTWTKRSSLAMDNDKFRQGYVEYKMFSWWMRGFNFKTVISTWGTFWAIITIAFAINYKVVITCIWESLNITIRHIFFQINLPVRIMAFHVLRRYCWHGASLWRFSLCLARLVTENFLVYVHHI